jgi:O-antigen ligase
LIWTQQQEDTPYAHNEYLHVWAESGLLGLMGFTGLVGLVLYRAFWGTWRGGGVYGWAALGAAGAMLVHSLVSYPLRLPLNGLVFWVLLGIMAGMARRRESKN